MHIRSTQEWFIQTIAALHQICVSVYLAPEIVNNEYACGYLRKCFCVPLFKRRVCVQGVQVFYIKLEKCICIVRICSREVLRPAMEQCSFAHAVGCDQYRVIIYPAT